MFGRSVHTKSTGTTDEKLARQIAQKFYGECLVQKGIQDDTLPAAHQAVQKQKLRFDRIVDQWLNKLEADAGDDERRLRHLNDCKGSALGKTGFATYFGRADVNSITPDRIDDFLAFKKANSPKGQLAATTIKRNLVLLNVVLKFAHHARLLTHVPAMPKVKTKDNPRAWFSHEEYRRLHLAARGRGRAAKKAGKLAEAVGWFELSDFIIFMVASFLRPGEWPALKHKHVKIVEGENAHLQLAITQSKTLKRISVTMGPAVSAYKRIAERNGKNPEAYLFKAEYANRQTARERMADAFEGLVSELGLKVDVFGNKRSTYSLRHTALMLRFTKGAEVNVLALAKNAGTSVDQLERFYLKRINPADLIANLQSFR
ncbi:hypothetical protein FHS91_003128 [Sphingobium xanthum]|uniref:tyrosine-type recombinase/integrase n=1 Tax=Sphingobium xanthum TaxID=1387165 RepID=UPI001C8C689B|nr:hypothetical protein [Sphingobium xanthum]